MVGPQILKSMTAAASNILMSTKDSLLGEKTSGENGNVSSWFEAVSTNLHGSGLQLVHCTNRPSNKGGISYLILVKVFST